MMNRDAPTTEKTIKASQIVVQSAKSDAAEAGLLEVSGQICSPLISGYHEIRLDKYSEPPTVKESIPCSIHCRLQSF